MIFWDDKKLKDGLVNLIIEIDKIAGGYWDNVIINITGGYCPIYYIFEDTDALMEVPYIPLDIKWSIFEKHKDFFRRLEREEILGIPYGIAQEERCEILSLLEKADNLYSLNPLGIILWEKFKKNYDFFYISSIVDDYLQKKRDYKSIGEKSFCELKRRLKSNPQDPDLHHRLKDIELPKGFDIFKHKENDLQVRILYKVVGFNTTYNMTEHEIYIGLIAIGRDVHNAESEYVEEFKRNSQKITEIKNYELYEIKKEESHV